MFTTKTALAYSSNRFLQVRWSWDCGWRPRMGAETVAACCPENAAAIFSETPSSDRLPSPDSWLSLRVKHSPCLTTWKDTGTTGHNNIISKSQTQCQTANSTTSGWRWLTVFHTELTSRQDQYRKSAVSLPCPISYLVSMATKLSSISLLSSPTSQSK